MTNFMAKVSAYGRTEIARVVFVTSRFGSDAATKVTRMLMSDGAILEKYQRRSVDSPKWESGRWVKHGKLKEGATVSMWVNLLVKAGWTQ